MALLKKLSATVGLCEGTIFRIGVSDITLFDVRLEVNCSIRTFGSVRKVRLTVVMFLILCEM